MKKHIITLIVVISVVCTAFTANEKFTVNIVESNIKWTGYAEAGNYSPTGNIRIKSGMINAKNGMIISGKIVIDMTTLSHENKDLEKHLKESDFFDCKKYPTSTFVIYKVVGKQITGKLTIKGITKSVSFPISTTIKNGISKSKVSLKVDRTEFNIKYNSSSYFQDLGSYAIKNEFDLDITIVASL
ncbi:MAG: YceI family protein [Bacteroidia bacterium]